MQRRLIRLPLPFLFAAKHLKAAPRPRIKLGVGADSSPKIHFSVFGAQGMSLVAANVVLLKKI